MRWHGHAVFGLDELVTDEWLAVTGRRRMMPWEAEWLLGLTDKSGKQLYAEEALSDKSGLKPLTPEQAALYFDVPNVAKYNSATPKQANLLYGDLHSHPVKR